MNPYEPFTNYSRTSKEFTFGYGKCLTSPTGELYIRLNGRRDPNTINNNSLPDPDNLPEGWSYSNIVWEQSLTLFIHKGDPMVLLMDAVNEIPQNVYLLLE